MASVVSVMCPMCSEEEYDQIQDAVCKTEKLTAIYGRSPR